MKSIFWLVTCFTVGMAQSSWGESNFYKKGSSEISADFSASYGRFSGGSMRTRLAYRYFLIDDLSFGVMGQRESSEIFKKTSYGPSLRWYFQRLGNWSLSWTTNLTFNEQVVNFTGEGYTSGFALEERLGIHYRINDQLSLNLSGGLEVLRFNDRAASFPIVDHDAGNGEGLNGLIGVTFTF